MSYTGIFVNMPVTKAESARDDDEQSRRQRQKQLERSLPHMRITDKNRSEKILADAMRIGSGTNSAHVSSKLSQPLTARSPQRLVHVEQSLNEIVGKDTPGSKVKEMKAADRSLLSQNLHDSEKPLQDSNNPPLASEALPKIKSKGCSLMSHDLHDLEERLQFRRNSPSASEILSIIKNLETKVQNQSKTEREAMTENDEQEDLLCSLDFIEGYVSAMASPREIRTAIVESLESLRGKILMPHAEPVSDIEWQQENILQLIGDTDAKCTLTHDAAGHTRVLIEVNEEALRAKSKLPRAIEPNKNKLLRAPAVGDDTLPLIVQKSV